MPRQLPRWRGAAPIQRAIMAGDRETAVMVMRMEEGLDTGPVCLAESIEIGPDLTAGELHDQMAMRGASLMVRALAALERGVCPQTPQPADGVTYAAKIDRAAMMNSVPCITTLTGGAATVSAIRALREEGIEVRSLQEYHARVTTA